MCAAVDRKSWFMFAVVFITCLDIFGRNDPITKEGQVYAFGNNRFTCCFMNGVSGARTYRCRKLIKKSGHRARAR